jgi:transcriptional regulator with XRE-family HTH domain
MKKVSSKSIGAKIKLARLEVGLTQTEFAEKIGVTSVMVSRYESGKSSPVRQIEAISKILGKSQDYFFGNDDKEELYQDIKELVKLLKDKAAESAWPFKPEVPLLNYEDIEDLQTSSIEELDTEGKTKISVSPTILKKDPQSFAVKVGINFAKSSFPKGTLLIVSPNIQAKVSNFVLKLGKQGLVAGKKATSRGKLIGTILQTLDEEAV